MFNLIPEIARVLGVAIGEKFKIKGNDELICMFTDDKGLMAKDGINASWVLANALFVALLLGKEEIVKE